jgi:hypothetical protein
MIGTILGGLGIVVAYVMTFAAIVIAGGYMIRRVTVSPWSSPDSR